MDSILGTTLEAGSGSYGNIFDVVLMKDSPGIRIDTLDFYTDRTYEITFEVWTTEGSVLGKPYPDTSWELIARASILGKGKNDVTSIPREVFNPVEVNPRTPIRGFLLILTTPDLRYTPDSNRQYAIYKANKNIAIMVGDGVTSYPYRGILPCATTPHRIWNGVVHYTEVN